MRIALRGVFFAALVLQAASFDAASIKPSDAPNGNSSGIDTDNGLLRAQNVTLKRCINGAYGLPEAQILGGPKWIDELRYEIVAKTSEHAGENGLMVMLQDLLADRFQLKLHHETRTVSGYELTLAKGGVKASPSEPGTDSATDTSKRGGRMDAKACSMSRLALKLADILGAPVSDATNASGKFNFSLRWVPDDLQAKPGASSDAPAGPSLFTALQEQLGVRLEARKVPVDVLVIDQAELPSEN
jgi:uncharacterized protein (TIGR03435 family)